MCQMFIQVCQDLTLYQWTKFWDKSKMKALGDHKINVAKTLKSVLGGVETTVGAGEILITC